MFGKVISLVTDFRLPEKNEVSDTTLLLLFYLGGFDLAADGLVVVEADAAGFEVRLEDDGLFGGHWVGLLVLFGLH